jgi:hypothetical protein
MRSRLINIRELRKLEMNLATSRVKLIHQIKDWVDNVATQICKQKISRPQQRDITLHQIICRRGNREVQYGIGYGLHNLAKNNRGQWLALAKTYLVG